MIIRTAKELGQFVPDNTKVAAESKQALLEHYGSESMFSRNLNFAQKTVKEYGDADFVKWLDESGMGNNPNFIKYNAKIGRELIEHLPLKWDCAQNAVKSGYTVGCNQNPLVTARINIADFPRHLVTESHQIDFGQRVRDGF